MTIENYFEKRIRPIVEDTKDNDSESFITKHISNSLIDEDQLARTFQEIVNCINLDDDDDNDNDNSDNTTITSSMSISNNFSRSNFHNSHHSLLPEFNSIFGGSGGSSFKIAVGSGESKTTKSSNTTGLGKSFLDDDWFPIKKPESSSEDININTTRSNVTTRPMTPNSSISSSFNHRSNGGEYFLRDGNSYNNLPPSDYICKLCNCDGHWMKDCRLYEPRTPPSSISSFKSTSSSNSLTGMTGNRTLLPPGNYVCRLCNVAGHWIDQCSKFQPKNDALSSSSGGTTTTTPVLPPMLGPGPTPNYRPPAYLSKPVPSNYICNLCNRPGHWIQQCTEFTPIINHKPSINKY